MYPSTISPSELEPSDLNVEKVARRILKSVMNYRRFSDANGACANHTCAKCLAPHLSKVIDSVKSGLPIVFVLPAFPGKSPNPAKVLGPLPDMAERRSLEFLQWLCDDIKKSYAPGARIILCSDGRVFSDVVGMREVDVTAYQNELSRMIRELGLSSISTFNLDELFDGMNYDSMRTRLMERHGASLDSLKASVKRGSLGQSESIEDQESHRLYLGITRFMFEDALVPGLTRSRTAIQKESRARAYEVIRRSMAWGNLVEAQFPAAIRLSIHPQGCGSKKLGIRLIGTDIWQTPWHAVAIEIKGRFMLMKRSHAELLGARLVYDRGQPSHYVLADEIPSAQIDEAVYGS